MNRQGASGAIYGLGAVGAIIYYVQHSSGFWDGALGVLKGLAWPAMVIYKVLDLLKM